MATKKKPDSNTIAQNKKARFDYFIEDEFEDLNVRIFQRRPFMLGDQKAIRVEGRASSALGGALAFQMTFVRHEKLIYRLTLLTIAGVESQYRGRGLTFARSFRPLDEEGMHSLKVVRLRIARALENETLQSLSERTRNALELVYTGVLNGIYASTPLAKRTPIKIGISEPYLPEPRESEAEADSKADTEGTSGPGESD